MAQPVLFEINTRYWLYTLRKKYDQTMTLEDIPDRELKSIAKQFDWVWLMGIWNHSSVNKEFLIDHPGLLDEVHEALDNPDDEDIIGSPYSIKTYSVHPMLGDEDDFKSLKKRFNELGVKVMVDFVPNHYGYQSDLTITNPNYFVHIDTEPSVENDHMFHRVETRVGTKWIAHGKDPYFSPWDDTFQLNYWNTDTRDHMITQLKYIAELADGVRCDMAMLVVNDIVEKTWSWVIGDAWDKPSNEFWPQAIQSVKETSPDFIFLGEVYWDMEWDMLEQGFDYAYDKQLYDRILDRNPQRIKNHLTARIDYQEQLCRFVENHDEERVASALGEVSGLAASAIILTLPGLSLIHHGQMTGQQIKIPVQLVRKKREIIKKSLYSKYGKIINYVREIIPKGARWSLLDVENTSARPTSTLLAWSWTTETTYQLVVINLGDEEADGLVQLDLDHTLMSHMRLEFKDYFHETSYQRHIKNISEDGLYVKLAPYQFHLFEITGQE